MSRNNHECKGIMRTDSGSIDYSFYDARSRRIRSEYFICFVKSLFKGEKESTTKISDDYSEEPNHVAICH